MTRSNYPSTPPSSLPALSATVLLRATAAPGAAEVLRATAVCAVLLLTACAPGKAPPKVRWRPCRLPSVSHPARCTTVEVPELHGAREPGTVKLRVAVIGAIRATPRPDPLYFIAGGPGQGAADLAGQVLAAFGRIRRERDLVFVDVRGTGGSDPMRCKLGADGASLSRLFDDRFDDAEVLHCARRYAARPFAGYRTAAIVADLERVAATLGHERLNVYGISYGTRVALQWLRTGSPRLRAVILDGVVPPEMVLFSHFGRDAAAAFDTLARDCLSDRRQDGRGCGDRFGDLRQTLRLLLDATDPPREVTITHPTTGLPARVELRAAGVAMAVRGLLYSAELQALLPLALDDAVKGDAGPLVTQALSLVRGAARASSFGMMFAVVCAEDVPRITAADLAAEASESVFGAAIGRQVQRACELWPHDDRAALDRAAPDREGLDRRPVRSELPTLLLSGALDPVTPAHWAELAARTLPHSLHVLVPGAAHGSFATGCVPELMADFIAAGSVQGLDPSCVRATHRPPFFVGRTGPAP